METKIKALLVATIISGFFAAGVASAENNLNAGGNPGGGLIKKIAENHGTTQLEALKKEQARLMELLAKLQARINQATTATSTTPSTVDLACAQTAVATRETSISTAYGTMSSCTAAVLTTRKGALATAWAITTNKNRNTAINKAWDDFRKARKACQVTYKNSIKSAWDTFKTSAKTCKITHEEIGKEGIDSMLEG